MAFFQLRLSGQALSAEAQRECRLLFGLLRELWPYGSSELGGDTRQRGLCGALFVEEGHGKRADDHYWRVSPVDGEAHRVSPEFHDVAPSRYRDGVV